MSSNTEFSPSITVTGPTTGWLVVSLAKASPVHDQITAYRSCMHMLAATNASVFTVLHVRISPVTHSHFH